jgi:hypothetical protein
MAAMPRFLFIAAIALLAACENPFNLRSKLESVDGPVVRPGKVDPKSGRYIPPVCAADGSYHQAVECLRRATVLRFRTPDGQGMVTRSSDGDERMVLYVGRGSMKGNWTAASENGGFIWTFNGARVDVVPPGIARIFELTIRFPDPKKKEGEPILVERDEKAITYEFTDARSGEGYVVKVDPASGHLRQVTVAGIDLTFG